MPEENLSFQPTKEMKSFGQQFTHIGMGFSIYSGVIKGKQHIEEPDKLEKQIVLDYVDQTSEDFKKTYQSLTEEILYTKDHKNKEIEPWKDFSIADILLLAYNHTIHHRAQAIVYLRLNGLTPPKYRF